MDSGTVVSRTQATRIVNITRELSRLYHTKIVFEGVKNFYFIEYVYTRQYLTIKWKISPVRFYGFIAGDRRKF